MSPWTVQDAKARLSEVLRRARGGEPQRIGAKDSCVVVSADDWAAARTSSLGAWLVGAAPRGAPREEAPRSTRRPAPFEEDPPA